MRPMSTLHHVVLDSHPWRETWILNQALSVFQKSTLCSKELRFAHSWSRDWPQEKDNPCVGCQKSTLCSKELVLRLTSEQEPPPSWFQGFSLCSKELVLRLTLCSQELVLRLTSGKGQPLSVPRNPHFVVKSWSWEWPLNKNHLCLGFQIFTLWSKELVLRLTSEQEPPLSWFSDIYTLKYRKRERVREREIALGACNLVVGLLTTQPEVLGSDPPVCWRQIDL